MFGTVSKARFQVSLSGIYPSHRCIPIYLQALLQVLQDAKESSTVGEFLEGECLQLQDRIKVCCLLPGSQITNGQSYCFFPLCRCAQSNWRAKCEANGDCRRRIFCRHSVKQDNNWTIIGNASLSFKKGCTNFFYREAIFNPGGTTSFR